MISPSFTIINLVAFLLFGIVVFFDLKKKRVPAFFTTSIIFILGMINIQNIAFGIMAFVFAWMLYETGFIGGMADVKMIAAIGLLCSGIYGIISLVTLVSVYGAFYNAFLKTLLQKDSEKIAFTVPIFLSYVVMVFAGVI